MQFDQGSYNRQSIVSKSQFPSETNRNLENLCPEIFLLGSNETFFVLVYWYLTSSVSSFVRKTTEKIGTLHTSPDLKVRQEPRGDETSCDEDMSPVTCPKEEDTE